ncbi:UDP-N-acetylmuramate dehydrogenase [Gillisia limnaea]|uniref:UDP-N-acetylenolpyruvoylglucosamine reductase n=1 Tax=Gillisia limnaea (strain DSM 15749 / LMG 21470 / R-8282) TaxID=865937 RepID=H2BZL4_GILLR|nr:UDP-N-acetylmuramate dehydrogenase [Gillisia limnaea]EHQ03423.1 UDP-N-acetylmuramate dehydrogenase [Gillisia limnaea DSM 15749]
MNISRNTSLKSYNTFGIDVNAKQFISINTIDELRQVLKQNYSGDLFILGGGSNMLLTKDIDAIVMHINILGKRVVRKTKNSVFVEALAGENWHQFVLWTLENNWGGLENLSLIPGNIGTAPIQNIGAYGVELKDTFVSCDAIDLQTLESISFSAEECEFGYRNSIFKNKVKGKYIITGVTFKLKKKNHVIQTNYGAIDESLRCSGISDPTIQDVSKAVIKIRQQKLPDPRVLGNSGSFFKNPVITKTELELIKLDYPEIPSYEISRNEAKIPAGWLIDKAGLKGYREGDAGVHKNQALVLVNYGNASGKEILLLAKMVQEKIKKQFNIDLEPEVNIF